jgi:hypothetical protein
MACGLVGPDGDGELRRAFVAIQAEGPFLLPRPARDGTTYYCLDWLAVSARLTCLLDGGCYCFGGR